MLALELLQDFEEKHRPPLSSHHQVKVPPSSESLHEGKSVVAKKMNITVWCRREGFLVYIKTTRSYLLHSFQLHILLLYLPKKH